MALSVSGGGTGRTSLTPNRVLIGNGTSPISISKVAPTGQFVGLTETQSISNKTLETSLLTNVSFDTMILPFDVPSGGTGLATIPTGKVLTTGTGGSLQATQNLPSSAFVGDTDTQDLLAKTISTGCSIGTLVSPSVLPVSYGGTGAATLASGTVLTGNAALAVQDSQLPPTGSFVGINDTQTLNAKTINSSSFGTLATPLPLSLGGLGAHTKTPSCFVTGNGSGNVINTIPRPLPASNGGLNGLTVANNHFVTTNGTNAVQCTVALPSQTNPDGAFNIVGVSDTQTLQNKTMSSVVLASPLSAPLSVANGGTNQTSLTSGFIMTTNSGGTAFEFVKQYVGGNLVGINDTQTLSAKTITTSSITNPTPSVFPITYGGTNLSSVTANSAVVGFNQASPTFKALPSSALVGTTEVQTLTNKTINSTDGNTFTTTAMHTTGSPVFVNTADASANGCQTLKTTSTTNATWQNLHLCTLGFVVANSISGANLNFTIFNGVFNRTFQTGDTVTVELRSHIDYQAGSPNIDFGFEFHEANGANGASINSIIVPNATAFATGALYFQVVLTAIGSNTWKFSYYNNLFTTGTQTNPINQGSTTAAITGVYANGLQFRLFTNTSGLINTLSWESAPVILASQ